MSKRNHARSMNRRTTNSSSKYFDTAIWSPSPFLRRVFNTRSRASACPEAGSSGRSLILVSVGSPVNHSQPRTIQQPLRMPPTGHDRPMIKHLQTECLPLRRSSQVRFKTIRIDHGYQSLDGVQRRSRLRNVLCYMASAACEDSVHR